VLVPYIRHSAASASTFGSRSREREISSVMVWRDAGGAGFWLATRLPVLRPASDLDLLVRAPQPLAPAQLSALCALQTRAGCRVDIQVDTGLGGFALMEYARGGEVMLKTDARPVLVNDPWQHREAA
jgi:phosphoribosyl-dephospho-CoA transferase